MGRLRPRASGHDQLEVQHEEDHADHVVGILRSHMLRVRWSLCMPQVQAESRVAFFESFAPILQTILLHMFP